jgi:hypothetical protein
MYTISIQIGRFIGTKVIFYREKWNVIGAKKLRREKKGVG